MHPLRSFFLGAAVATALLGCGGSTDTPPDGVVMGYLPAYADPRATADRTDLHRLTHLAVAFANPSASGSFVEQGVPTCMSGLSAPDLAYVVEQAHAAGVKVLVSLAGGTLPACAGDWRALLGDDRRGATLASLVTLVDAFGFDGVDVDLEGALLTAIDHDGHYTPFVAALRTALPGKLITAATASDVGGMVPASSLPYFDLVGLMAYDEVGPTWGQVGDEHSTYALAQRSIATWQARGLRRDQLLLGLPFYGYGFNGYRANYSYGEILREFGAGAAQHDLVGTACATCAYVTYNGVPTLQAKVRLALQTGAGVMVWDLSQDAGGADSLLATVSAAAGH